MKGLSGPFFIFWCTGALVTLMSICLKILNAIQGKWIIYCGALHLRMNLISHIYKYFAALPLNFRPEYAEYRIICILLIVLTYQPKDQHSMSAEIWIFTDRCLPPVEKVRSTITFVDK